MNPAVIIGNGVTRKQIDLNKIGKQAKKFGCNALYREFDNYDFLVAIDEGMIGELLENVLHKASLIIPPEEDRYEENTGRRNNAGMVAMKEAIKMKHDTLYCLGFDFILSGEISTDNVFKNSDNYGPVTHAREEDNFHRVRYLEWFASQHKNVTFIFVVPDENIGDVKPIEGFNITAMRTRDFIKKLES